MIADDRYHIKLNIGCGLDITSGYQNLDNSLSLRIQNRRWLRVPVQLFERLLGRRLYTRFPEGVRWWDVNRGLPYQDDFVAAIYSSHMLEHLPRQEAEAFLREAYRVLAPSGVFRLALPDLEMKAREYLSQLERLRGGSFGGLPADQFMQDSRLGLKTRWTLRRPASIYRALSAREGHYWMWDALSLIALLRQIGFHHVWERSFQDSLIPEVCQLDVESRRDESFYVEAQK